MATDDVIVINQGYEVRTSKSGKQRVTVVVKSEPVIINTDPKALGRPVAAAIVHHLREKVAGISAKAAANTLRARATELATFVRGAPWVMKRFSGGKMGSLPPNQSDRAFNNSGRFAKSITGNASSDGSWRINVAANRLDSSTSGGVERIYQKLLEYVPEFGDPGKLLENDIVRKSIERSMQDMIKKAEATSKSLGIGVARGIFELVRAAAEFADVLGELAG
jgi:hypothetical protein